MTLSTLQTMNLPLADLRSALSASATRAAVPPFMASPPPDRASAPSAAATATSPSPDVAAGPEASGATAKPAVDPMQWWGALTQQFTDIATKALQESGSLAARNLAATASPTPAAAQKTGATRAARKRKS